MTKKETGPSVKPGRPSSRPSAPNSRSSPPAKSKSVRNARNSEPVEETTLGGALAFSSKPPPDFALSALAKRTATVAETTVSETSLAESEDGPSSTMKSLPFIAPSLPPDSDETDANGPESEPPMSLDSGFDVAEISGFVPTFGLGEQVSIAPPHVSTEPRVSPKLEDLAKEMRAVEAEVDRILDETSKKQKRTDDSLSLRAVMERLREAIPVELPGENGDLVDAAKDVLSTDYYLRQWGRLGLRNRSEEVDEFGYDPVYEQRFQPMLDALYRHYFRVEVHGIENVPAQGRCILVANHSGVLPYDGLMVRAAVRKEHPSSREVRWLAEDFVYHLPFVGAFMSRIGAVRACQENAERLLKQERCILVFPEGIKGIGKLYRERYKLQRFGRGGFVKLALRTGAPLVPVSIVGAEEASPMLHRVEYLTKLLGLPFVPITPTFPLLGPLGLIPAPTKWTIEFGTPISLEDGPEAADDALLVNRVGEQVRDQIQTALDARLERRKSVFFG